MLRECGKTPRVPGPKWNKLEDDRLTQADFYDDLLFPRDAFRLESGRAYCNEQAMLTSMNILHRALRRGSGEEWKIFFEDGSRVVRLVRPEQSLYNGPTASRANRKVSLSLVEKSSNVESSLKKCKTSQGRKDFGQEFVVGRGRAPYKSVNKARSRLTTYQQNLMKERKTEPEQSVSLTHLRAEWQLRPEKTRHEVEKRLRQSGELEPFSLEELKRAFEEKKRYLEKVKLGGVLEEESKREYTGAKIIELFDSEDGDDSDSSVSSCRTRIIRYAKPKGKKMSDDSSDEELRFNMRGTKKGQKRLHDRAVAYVNKSNVVNAKETNVTFILPQDGVMSVDNVANKDTPPKDESVEIDDKKEAEPFKIENRAISRDQNVIDHKVRAPMLNRDPSMMTALGIFDRSQWYKDLARNNKQPMARYLLREGYDVKQQKETSDRLSIPKYGPFSIRRDGLKQTKEQLESKVFQLRNGEQGLKDCTSKQISSKGMCLKQDANGTITNENGTSFTCTKGIKSKSLSEVKQAGSSFKILKLSRKENPILPRPQFNLRTNQGLNVPPKFLSRRDARLRSEHNFPYQLKQTGSGDAFSRSTKSIKPDFDLRTTVGLNDRSKPSARGDFSSQSKLNFTRRTMPSVETTKSSKPDFDLRTTVGLNDRSKPSARGDFSSQSKLNFTRRTMPSVKSTVVSSAEVNRKKVARDIDLENLRIMRRLGEIKNGRSQDKISFRVTRREQLPLTRILNRAVTT